MPDAGALAPAVDFIDYSHSFCRASWRLIQERAQLWHVPRHVGPRKAWPDFTCYAGLLRQETAPVVQGWSTVLVLLVIQAEDKG